MIAHVKSVEGETRVFDFVLDINDVPFDLTGATQLALELTPRGIATTTTISTGIAATDLTRGQIAYSPEAGALLQLGSPYRWRFKLTGSDGKRYYFPNEEPGTWIVRKP